MSRIQVVKTIAFSSQSDDFHIAIKLKNVLRWLKSGAEVQVHINSPGNSSKGEEIYKNLERKTKGGALVKFKNVTPQTIKFVLKPTADAANFVIGEPEEKTTEDLAQNDDIFSEEYEKKLEQSIAMERSRNMKKRS